MDMQVELTAHAVDRASQQLLDDWRETRVDETEGLYSWLARIAQEAFDKTGRLPRDTGDNFVRKDIHAFDMGMHFVFVIGRFYPLLKTVSKQIYQRGPNDQR